PAPRGIHTFPTRRSSDLLVQKQDLRPGDVARTFTLSLLLSALVYGVLCAVAGPAGRYLGQPDFAAFLRVLGLLVLLVPFRAVAGDRKSTRLNSSHRTISY